MEGYYSVTSEEKVKKKCTAGFSLAMQKKCIAIIYSLQERMVLIDYFTSILPHKGK